ncbi:MAG: ferrous iron transport protein B [Bacteroidetes bacterium]|nr:ferrous iron transport protein B [Bacteroidota bacterium]
MKDITVALIGNPNSGKSTLFNGLTGLNQRTGNYPGVTVDKHIGYTRHNEGETTYKYTIIDLPGTYSLFPKSLDEEVACKSLIGAVDKVPDVVVIVADASNLKRHFLLATQVLDLKMPCVLVLNMIDEADHKGIRIYTEELEKLMGIDVIPVNSRNREGIDALKKAIANAHVPHAEFYNKEKLRTLFPGKTSYRDVIASQFADKTTCREFEASDNVHRFSQINYMLAKGVKAPQQASRSVTDRLDTLFTHRIFGYFFFLLILLVIFQFIFFIAEYPMSWIEDGFSKIMEVTSAALPHGQISDLLVNGVLAGLSGIVVFVPQIALLFFFIAILEDTGYMARVSFILDKLMRRFGLNGRSVIPMISSVACAVPSIMGTRTITNWKERFITILVTPLISCSARLPVYTLLISMMYMGHSNAHTFFNYRGLVLMAMYLLGFFAAIVAALVFKYILKARERSYFIMEMPVYRKPQWQTVGVTVLGKVKVFLWDAGKIIMAISIVLWFLTSHAPGNAFADIEHEYAALASQPQADGVNYEAQMNSRKLEASYAGILGKKIEPMIRPLGFDWKIGISLITSFAAREVFVGTMATIYSANADEEDPKSIREKLVSETNPDTGLPRYNHAVCWSLLIFYAFAMQCMSTLATTYRETKHWKWPLIQLLFMSGLAYISSFAVYQALA